MNNIRPWTTALDSSFISKLTKREIAAGMEAHANGPIRDGLHISFAEWDRESREIGRQIIAEHPEYAYILPIIEAESLPYSKCPGCGMDFVPRIVKRIPGTLEMGTEPSTICQECYINNCPQ